MNCDAIDRLPVDNLPEQVAAAAWATLPEALTAIATEGVGGSALKRLLARDILVGRTQLRALEGLRNVELRKFARGGDERRLLIYEKLVQQQHRRLLASVDALARVGGGAATVRIAATNAAVVLGERR